MPNPSSQESSQAKALLTPPARLRIGTRASALARKQTDLFCEALAQHFPNMAFDITPITTSGDTNTTTPLYEIGGKGLFIKELDSALQAGTIDVAVHSAKDIETNMPADIQLAMIMERGKRHDCLISDYQSLAALPQGAVIGTSSPRRRAQLLAIRPDLKIIPLRGKVETRLQKWRDKVDGLDAIILAKIGLERIGLTDGVVLDLEEMLPSAGQGIIAATIRADNQDLHNLLFPLSHPVSRDELIAERALLRALDGNCHSAIGVLTQFQHRNLNDQKRVMPAASRMVAQVTHLNGAEYVRVELSASEKNIADPEMMGTLLGEKLLAENNGKARELLGMSLSGEISGELSG